MRICWKLTGSKCFATSEYYLSKTEFPISEYHLCKSLSWKRHYQQIKIHILYMHFIISRWRLNWKFLLDIKMVAIL